MSKILTAGMKRRATYESLVRDTILEPKDKIKLPNREASILRRTQQLSRYDDDDFLGLETVNEKINKERIQQIELLKLIAQKPMGSIQVERSRQSEVKSYDIGSDVQYKEDAFDIHEIREQEAKRMAEQHIRELLEQAELNIYDESIVSAVQRFKSLPKPQSETDTPQEIPQQTEQSSVSRKVAKNLGPEFGTSDPKFMKELTSQTRGTSSKDTPGASSSSKDVPKETIPLISSSAASASADDTDEQRFKTIEMLDAFKRTIKAGVFKDDEVNKYSNLISKFYASKPRTKERDLLTSEIKNAHKEVFARLIPPRSYIKTKK